MSTPLHCLLIEDAEDDALLVLRQLRDGGYDVKWERVETPEAMRDALRRRPWDIVISDYKMPRFSGSAALEQLKASGLDLPFIIVSGTIGEELAVTAMKAGASDYLMKGKLARLVPAVQRELRDAVARRERKNAEAALHESEDRLRQLAENINEVIWMTNPEKRLFLYISPAYDAIWGRSREQLYRTPELWLENIHPDDRARIRGAALIKQPMGNYNETYRIVRPDGAVRWIRDRAYPVRDEKGGVYRIVGVAEDFTEQRQLEEKYLQAQRMEAIGTLAGGIAHDFNNILAGIVGFTSLARQAAGDNAELLDYLNEIGRAGSRATDLVRQILAFSRTDSQTLVPMQLRHVIAEAVQLLRAAIPSTIVFDVELSSNMPAVLGNATQLHQVVMNLGTNASHAMRDRPGQLGIRLEVCVADEALAAELPDLAPGPCVRLTVSDTGCGMDAATRQRVFEPFFTTKAPGEGTGLGLSVVHGIVRSHQGAIRLRSEAGRGTTFEIYLPTIVAQPLPDSEKPDEIPCGHGERILFVDDEMLLVRLGERMLRQSGYAVEGEDRALAALARLEREPQAFQLIVTDQTMPGLTGLEFARRVQALRANLPVVLMSGYSLALTPEQIRESGVREVLTKPYTAATLAAAVRRHLPDNPPPDHAPHTADR